MQVFGLEFCKKDLVEQVKSRRSKKTYRAVVRLEEDVSEKDLEQLEQLLGTVHQQTPTRVEHRRADKTRERDVHEISWEKTGERKIEIEIQGDAGLYIKELISGDEEKTEPSVSQILGIPAECEHLDVVDIEKPPGYEDI